MKKFFSIIALAFVATVAMAQSKPIHIEVNNMVPQKYPSRVVSGGYFLHLEEGVVELHLPYMGESYFPSFNSDGLNFKEPVTNLKEKTKKKKSGLRTDTSFKVEHEGSRYDITVTTWENGETGFITVNPMSGTSCEYSGPETK